MSFRDNNDALLARADALAQENRRLRERIEELEATAGAADDREALKNEVAGLRKQLEDNEARRAASEARSRRSGRRRHRHGGGPGRLSPHASAEIGIYASLGLLALVFVVALLVRCT